MSRMGDFVVRFMRSRRLSMSGLSAKLGYKSQTSMARIIHGKANAKSVESFAKILTATFEMTPEERQELYSAVRIEAIGWEGYEAEMEMWAFIRVTEPDTRARVIIEDVKGGQAWEIYERYKRYSNIKIMLLNCQYIPIYLQLKRLVTENGARVSHYVYSDCNAASTIRAVNAAMPLFYENNYSGYVFQEGEQPDHNPVRGMVAADVFFCQYTEEDGLPMEDMVIFDGESHGHGLAIDGCKEALSRMISLPLERYRPIKNTWMHGGFNDYIAFCRQFADLEFNRSVYKIMPDICMDFVPGDIFVAAVRGGPLPHDDYFVKTVAALELISKSRFENAFSKRKPTYTILKQNAMRRFAQTGRTADHAWAMRAFTPRERIAILENLIVQQKRNPYFNLYFLEDDNAVRDAQIIYYEDVGMLVLECDSNYDLSKGHTEVLITHAKFTRLFKEFMLENLIKTQTLTAEETTSVLRDLVIYCSGL